MTGIDDLIAELRVAVDSLQGAVQAAASCWESPLLEPEGPPLPGRESSPQNAWTPRDAAEHATYGFALNVAFAAQQADGRLSSFGDFRTDWRRRLEAGETEIPSVETSALASAALAEVGTQSFATLRAIPFERLSEPVEFMPGQDAYIAQRGVHNDGDMATALHLSAAHMLDHAAQIQRAVDEL